MERNTKKYSNGEVTIVWQPETCIHSTICWKGTTGLPNVFNPDAKPWINTEGASTKRIIEQVEKCPSGALSYYWNNEKESVESLHFTESTVETVENGPLLIYGNITVKNSGTQEVKRNKVTSFCRCGASERKPYCDGKHAVINFKG